MWPDLQALQAFVHKAQQVDTQADRMELIRGSESLRSLLSLIYDPTKVFFVTSRGIQKFMQADQKTSAPQVRIHFPTTLEAFLEALHQRQLTGHDALQSCSQALARMKPALRPAFLAACDKKLQIRMGAALFLKVWPDFITVFRCTLAHNFEDYEAFVATAPGSWWLSQKVDGNRTLIRKNPGAPALCLSRTGLVYPVENIPELLPLVRAFDQCPDGVYDGEMVVTNEQGQHIFHLVNGLMNTRAAADRRRLPSDVYLQFLVFNYIALEDFDQGHGTTPWVEQQRILSQSLPRDVSRIRMLPQIPHIHEEKMWQMAQDEGWEGVVYTLGTVAYVGKRTKHLLKRKIAEEGEFLVEEVSLSTQMVPGSSWQTQHVLEHVGVTFRGRRAWVSGGFTWQERVEVAQDPQSYVGWTIRVRYNGATENEVGIASLRHARKVDWWATEPTKRRRRVEA
jgi:hypothetical protein